MAVPLALVAAALLALAAAAPGAGARVFRGHAVAALAATSRSAQQRPAPHFRFFSPTSFWNTPADGAEALDPRSAALAGALAEEVQGELADGEGPSISTTRYGVPVYTVPAEQPTVRVALRSPTPAPALQAAFEAVPLPADAKPTGGSDANLVVYQPASDRLWEFWRLRRGAEGPEASWGGAMEHVSSNPGVYGPEAWPEAKPWWGSSASSLSIAGGLIRLEDLRRGSINHALALAVPDVRAGVFALPAQRSDGQSSDPRSLPEGAHLRLDPKLDLDALAMPPLTRMIAEAAQRYGIFVRDGAGVVHFFGEDPVTIAPKNPYAGPHGYFEGRYPGQLLASFPWGRLQVLRMELR